MQPGSPSEAVPAPIADTKQFRADLDGVLQRLKAANTGTGPNVRWSHERFTATEKIQEAIMWLGMDLKGMKEAGLGNLPNPYPESYNPQSAAIEPTAEGLKL